MESIKLISDLLSGFLTPIIAFITVYIAYQQYRINKIRTAKELYEKRIIIYGHVLNFIKLLNLQTVTDNDCAKFVNQCAEIPFLFNKELDKYTDTLFFRAKNLIRINNELLTVYSEPGNERKQLMHEKSEIIKLSIKEVDIAQNKFGKFLKIGTV